VDGRKPELGERKLSLRNQVRDWVRAFRPQLRFCLRATVAALLALAIANSLNFPLHGSWMVLTAVVVTQVSVGGSLRATLDYVVGTLAGAVYAAAVGLLVPHVTALGQAIALTLAVAPLSLAAALRPSFRVAPFSAVLVLLIGGALGENPVMSAVVRVLEVALGGAVAAAVSMLVFPERAHKLGIEATSRILRDMAGLLPAVLGACTQSADLNGIRRRQDDLGRAVGAFDDLVAEATGLRNLSPKRSPSYSRPQFRQQSADKVSERQRSLMSCKSHPETSPSKRQPPARGRSSSMTAIAGFAVIGPAIGKS
jgi:uncharacterized membrane protein YccC